VVDDDDEDLPVVLADESDAAGEPGAADEADTAGEPGAADEADAVDEASPVGDVEWSQGEEVPTGSEDRAAAVPEREVPAWLELEPPEDDHPDPHANESDAADPPAPEGPAASEVEAHDDEAQYDEADQVTNEIDLRSVERPPAPE
jgi:hypothetical protein